VLIRIAHDGDERRLASIPFRLDAVESAGGRVEHVAFMQPSVVDDDGFARLAIVYTSGDTRHFAVFGISVRPSHQDSVCTPLITSDHPKH
jgi:hypothetical protein